MSASTTRIVVYAKPACVQCNATYKALDLYGFHYEVIDISVDIAARDFVMSLGYLQAPIVYAHHVPLPHVTDVAVSADHWSAFRPDRIRLLAAKLGVDVDEVDRIRAEKKGDDMLRLGA